MFGAGFPFGASAGFFNGMEDQMTIYLAGPMRGIADDNRPAFDAAAAYLRDIGHVVYSPAEHDRELNQPIGVTDGQELKKQILWDLERITEVDCVVLLSGWHRSVGVRLELEMARFVGCDVRCLSEIKAMAELSKQPAPR